MAVIGLVTDMYDIALKPRMLRYVLLDPLLDEEREVSSISPYRNVLSLIRTYKLLSETCTESTDRKVVESWKSAMDAWLDRVAALISSSKPDKCLVGIWLLKLTCLECSSGRFLASYHVWLHNLLPHLQVSAAPSTVLMASCTAMSDVFRRLGGCFMKKDGNLDVGKVFQSLLNMVNDIGMESETLLEGFCELLCTILSVSPHSIRRLYENIEDILISKLMSGKVSTPLLNKIANSLALLPRSKGDGNTWCQLIMKILFTVNAYLNDVFQALEDETTRDETTRSLCPSGKESSPLLGFQKILQDVPVNSLFPGVSSLLHCCSVMLSSSYPVHVRVPIRPLLSVVGRMLMVNGSVPKSLSIFISGVQQEFICSQLPVLHSCSFELVIAVVKGFGNHLLPYAGQIVRVMTQYLRTCALPELRSKAYYVMKILVLSMGAGMANYLAPDLMKHIFMDLNPCNNETSSKKVLPVENLNRSKKKRKRTVVTTPSSIEQARDNASFVVEMPSISTLLSVKIAALEALEVLLTSSGASLSESWHGKINNLVITVATAACEGRWADSYDSTLVDFQLTSLRALLACLLSCSHGHLQYMAQAVELYHGGRKVGGTRIANFCVHAISSLDFLIHPDFHEGGRSLEYSYDPRTPPSPVEANLIQSDSESDELLHKYHSLIDSVSSAKNLSMNPSAPKDAEMLPGDEKNEGKDDSDKGNCSFLTSKSSLPVVMRSEGNIHKCETAEVSKMEDADDERPSRSSLLTVKPDHLRYADDMRSDLILHKCENAEVSEMVLFTGKENTEVERPSRSPFLTAQSDVPDVMHSERDVHKCESAEVLNINSFIRKEDEEGERPSRCKWLDAEGARKLLLAQQCESSSESFPDIVDQEPDSEEYPSSSEARSDFI